MKWASLCFSVRKLKNYCCLWICLIKFTIATQCESRFVIFRFRSRQKMKRFRIQRDGIVLLNQWKAFQCQYSCKCAVYYHAQTHSYVQFRHDVNISKRRKPFPIILRKLKASASEIDDSTITQKYSTNNSKHQQQPDKNNLFTINCKRTSEGISAHAIWNWLRWLQLKNDACQSKVGGPCDYSRSHV